MRLESLEQLTALYTERGGRAYGEDVTQLEHALQCATLAEADGASPSLVVAALLHDVGHLVEEEAAAQRADMRHEALGTQLLSGLFGHDVRMPIALHVAAKRYLCFCEPDYALGLSAASQASLLLQGGAFDASQAAAFERAGHWREAVALRRFDDSGKRLETIGRHFNDFLPLLQSVSNSTRIS